MVPNTFGILLSFSAGLRIGFSMICAIAAADWPLGTQVAISMFTNLDNVPGCGFLCNPNDTFANQNVPSWTLGGATVISGTGGTATISEI